MRYISWGVFYEGPTDALYFDVLIPRIIRDLIFREGNVLVDIPDTPAVRLGKHDRSIDAVAAEACAAKDAFHTLFVHADTGGRAQEGRLEQRSSAYCEAMQTLCNWPQDYCITVTPRHETEAWIIADSDAVTSALGYSGNGEEIGLPTNAQAAELLPDPKQRLREAIETVAGRRRGEKVENLFPAIG